MQHAIILCEPFCLSRARLLETLASVRQGLPGFDFRLASETETKDLLASHQPQFLPLIVMGRHSLSGVPSHEELTEWVLNLSSG